MADLASLAEFDSWLGGAVAAENTVRQAFLDYVEATFEAQCGRREYPFSAALPNRTEVLDGTGTCEVYTRYPIGTLTSVVLGDRVSTPDETLVVGDLLYAAGTRRIVRTDGGWFGRFARARYVHITYDTQADLPTDAKMAVLAEAARLYRARGSEDVQSETMGPYSITVAKKVPGQDDPVWAAAIAANVRVV